MRVQQSIPPGSSLTPVPLQSAPYIPGAGRWGGHSHRRGSNSRGSDIVGCGSRCFCRCRSFEQIDCGIKANCDPLSTRLWRLRMQVMSALSRTLAIFMIGELGFDGTGRRRSTGICVLIGMDTLAPQPTLERYGETHGSRGVRLYGSNER